MPFRNVVAEPEVLRAIVAAYEAAWIEIQPGIPPLSRAAEREYLGGVVVGLWELDGLHDLSARALAKYRASMRVHIPMRARHEA